jgi:hypothetical protein
VGQFVTAETRQLLAWIAEEPRTYPEAIDVWRTACPQHSVWEDALADRLVEVVRNGPQAHVVVTSRGRAALGDV